MRNQLATEIKIYSGAIATFVLHFLSNLTVDLVKDIMTIGVGASTIGYTLYKWYKEVKENNKKDNE